MKTITLWMASAILLILPACKDEATQVELQTYRDQAALEEANKAVAERWHYDLALARNWEVAEEILAPDITIYNHDGSIMAQGIEAVKGFDEIWKSLENAEIKHHQIIAEGDRIMILWDMAFDHNQELFGLPPSGNRVSDVYGIDLFLIDDGKIKEFWQYYDQLGMMEQMKSEESGI
ncbi:MAG: ester cyclase [Bacteroidales bacterium]